MNKETRHSYYFIIIIFSYIPHTALSDASHICSSDSNYTSNSTFETNLGLLFTSLIFNTPATGFHNDSKGDATEHVYGLAQCMDDSSIDVCRNCVNTSVQQIIQLCPQQKSGIIWLDKCILRYSNQSFFSSVDTSVKLILYNIGNASEPERFTNLLGRLMDFLLVKANASSHLFAIDSVEFTSTQKIYGLLMCTRDLSKNDCSMCLQSYIGDIPSMGNGHQQGGVLLGMSCYLRYEMYPIYNLSADPAETPPTVASPPDAIVRTSPLVSSVPGKSDKTGTIVAAAVSSAIVTVVLLTVTYFGLSCWLIKKVWQHWNGGTALELKDQRLDGDHFSAEGMLKCLHIGLLCVHEDPTQRPSMTSIVSMLNSYSTSLPAPSPPAYSFASYMMNGAQPRMDEASPVKTGINSVNNASITEIQPR